MDEKHLWSISISSLPPDVLLAVKYTKSVCIFATSNVLFKCKRTANGSIELKTASSTIEQLGRSNFSFKTILNNKQFMGSSKRGIVDLKQKLLVLNINLKLQFTSPRSAELVYIRQSYLYQNFPLLLISKHVQLPIQIVQGFADNL